MATLKDCIGIAQLSSASFDINSTGNSLTNCSSEYLSNLKNSPLTLTKDQLISEGYTLLSFALSRNDTEKIWSAFEKPYIFLAVQGCDYKGTSITKSIHMEISPGSYCKFQWEGNFAICRVLIPNINLKNINIINGIGIVVARDSSLKGSDSAGRIYQINANINIDDLKGAFNGQKMIKNFKDWQTTFRVEYNWIITQYSSDQNNKAKIQGKIAIAPLKTTNDKIKVIPKGINPTTLYTNDSYYANNVQLFFSQRSFSGTTEYPSIFIIQNSKNAIIDGQYRLLKSEYESGSNCAIVYGGYEYEFEYTKQIEHYKNFGNFRDNEEEFSKYFSFVGQRYRTKFNEHGYKDKKECFKLKKHYVSGTLVLNNDFLCPFSFSQKQINNDGADYILYKENNSGIDKYFTHSIKARNLLTSEEEEFSFNLPLQDEYEYYLFDLEVKQKFSDELENLITDQQEIVLYYGNEVFDSISNNTTSLVKINTDNGVPTQVTSNFSSEWISLVSYKPLASPNLNVSSEKSSTNSYFAYYFPKFTFSNDDITSKIKWQNEFDYYTILHCKQFPTDVSGIVTNCLIKDNQFYYQLNNGGLGDYNEEYSANAFINYARNSNKGVGLSSLDRNEKLTISNGENFEVSIFGNPSIYKEQLQLFYTGIDNVVSLGTINTEELTFNDDNSLDLTFKYTRSINGTEYTIFEFTIENVQIASGTRPLGLRKNGIIINPLEQKEELPIGIAQRTNLIPSQNGEQLTIAGVLLQGSVTQPTGMKIDNSQKDLIRYEETRKNIEDKYTGQGKWYFDDVNLPELQTKADQTATDLTYQIDATKEGSLAEKISNNYTNLAGLYNILSGASIEVLTETKSYENATETTLNTDVGDWIKKTREFKFTNNKIQNTSFLLPTFYVSWNDQSEGYYRDFVDDIFVTLSSISQSNGVCTIKFDNAYFKRLESKRSKFNITVNLLVINFPTIPSITTSLEPEQIEEI